MPLVRALKLALPITGQRRPQGLDAFCVNAALSTSCSIIMPLTPIRTQYSPVLQKFQILEVLVSTQSVRILWHQTVLMLLVKRPRVYLIQLTMGSMSSFHDCIVWGE